MKITDVSNVKKPEVKLKPIELISCLQATPSPYYYFGEISGGKYPIPLKAKEIVRLAKISYEKEFDLIAIYREGDPWPVIYLGHWNDGVI